VPSGARIGMFMVHGMWQFAAARSREKRRLFQQVGA